MPVEQNEVQVMNLLESMSIKPEIKELYECLNKLIQVTLDQIDGEDKPKTSEERTTEI